MTAAAPKYRSAWVLDLVHPTLGTFRVATADLTEAADVTALGAVYRGRILNGDDVAIVEELSDWFSGVVNPTTTTIILDNADALFGTGATEWRTVPATLRWYERTTGTLSAALNGVVVDADARRGQLVLVVSAHDPSIWETLLPRQLVDSDTFPSATDTGAPIPVVFGVAYVSPPYCGRDETNDPGGYDFLVGHQVDADDATLYLRVKSVFWDAADTPGLELVTGWDDAPGSPTSAGPNTFTVADDGSIYSYEVGTPLRFRADADPGVDHYGMITAINGLTITVDAAISLAGLTAVALASEYLVEANRYSVGGADLLSVRTFGGTEGGMVVLAESALKNPAAVLREILRNTRWGLAQTVDAAAFATAVQAFVDVGLTYAIGYALGGDQSQRSAGEVVRGLLQLYGMRLRLTASGAWTVTVDSAPAAAVATFGFGDGVYNNVLEVVSNKRRTLQEAVKTLHMRYGGTQRIQRSAEADVTLVPTAHQSEIHADVLTIGSEQTLTMPWLRASTHASRALAYLAKSMRYGDHRPVILVGPEARGLQLGDLVHYVNVPDGVDDDFRVWRIRRTLAAVELSLAGYDASIFAYSGGDTSPGAEPNVDERRTTPGLGQNLVINSDFSVRPTSATFNATMLPGWRFLYGGFLNATVTRTGNVALGCKGGGFLTIDTVAGVMNPGEFWTMGNVGLIDYRAMVVEPGKLYIASAYVDVTLGWRWQVRWTKANGTQNGSDVLPQKRVDPSDRNGNEWKRFYCIVRAPATDVAFGGIGFLFATSGTGPYRIDAVQFEEVGRHTTRPTHYKRHATWGVDPAVIQPGDQTVRADGQLEHGTRFGHVTITVDLTSAGSEVRPQLYGAPLIPSRCIVTSVTTRKTGITGPTALNIGYARSDGVEDLSAWGAEVPVTDGTTDMADATAVSPVNFPVTAASDVVITAVGGDFTGGTITVAVHYTTAIAPTA